MSAYPIPPLQEHIDRAQDYGAREEAIEEANVRDNIDGGVGGQELFFVIHVSHYVVTSTAESPLALTV